MLNQMFTADNFREIFDRENRKGRDVASDLFPNLEPFKSDIREKIEQIRALRRNGASMKPEDFDRDLNKLRADLKDLKAKKSSAVDQELRDVSRRVMKSSFQIAITSTLGPKGKTIYCVDETPEAFFVIKQLQRNIAQLYKVKQSNRHDLVCRVRDTVISNFPYEVVRTDIASFYESVNAVKLLEKFDRDQLLSPSSKKYIKQVLSSYFHLAGTSKGLPRGIGISAYLAELSLREIDQKIQGLPGIVLYCRYVDDIIAIFARPPVGPNLGSYLDSIVEILAEQDLKPNPKKTYDFNLGSATHIKFEYLGYRFFVSKGACKISPSATKIRKYKLRLDASFRDYGRRRNSDSRRAFRDLVARVKFLTGNTRLFNSKAGAATGIYYSNSLATQLGSFDLLDGRLKEKIKQIRSGSLRRRLKKYKFVEGFEQRRFHNFSTKELQKIVQVWKNV